MASFLTVNPATGAILRSYEHFDQNRIETVLTKAHEQYLNMKTKSIADRKSHLSALGAAFRERRSDLAKIMTLEMGKPIKDSLAEVEKCASAFDYFAASLETLLAPEEVKTGYARSRIVKDSIGPILAVMPWNFPLWQITRFAAPAVGIGNPILLKHADLVAGTAELIGEIFDSVAKGLLYNLPIDHDQAAVVIADRRCAAVTLTGSARAGKEIAQTAGKFLKKTVLELGGSDAYVVFADSDVDKAAKICADGRMVNNGQSCVAAKRFVVHHSILSRFIEMFEKRVRELAYGDPLREATATGSLAAKKFQDQLLEQCSEIEKAGAKKIFDLADGQKFDWSSPSAFFPARAYLVDEKIEMAFTDEFFGPVALVFSFKSDEQALAIANRSIYGLGGAVFSKDIAKAESFARLMEAGFIAINDQVKSDARLPFGGVKDSGYGRELSHFGFTEFCNIKTLGFGDS